MTRGNAAAARFRLIVRCRECRHEVEPDLAEQTVRYGADTFPTAQMKPESSRAIAATGCR